MYVGMHVHMYSQDSEVSAPRKESHYIQLQPFRIPVDHSACTTVLVPQSEDREPNTHTV